MTTTAGSGQVQVVRELDAPPEEVWRAWSEADLVRRWWGPVGFTCPRADVDLRVGGSTVVTMQAPAEYGGGRIHNRWTYTAVAEPHRLEFLSTFADEDGQRLAPVDVGIPVGVPDEVPHLVELDPLPHGRTRLRVVERGYTEEAARALSERGQEECLDKLQALFAAAR